MNSDWPPSVEGRLVRGPSNCDEVEAVVYKRIVGPHVASMTESSERRLPRPSELVGSVGDLIWRSARRPQPTGEQHRKETSLRRGFMMVI